MTVIYSCYAHNKLERLSQHTFWVGIMIDCEVGAYLSDATLRFFTLG
jgi:hypothetical protein